MKKERVGNVRVAVLDRELFVSYYSLTIGAAIFLALIMFFTRTIPLYAVEARVVPSDFRFNFNTPGVLIEAGSMDTSSSPYFWVNSGAKLILNAQGAGSTVIGNLPTSDPFRILYAANNPEDTDNGYHPQNIFRLLTRSTWQNSGQEVTFRIKAQNLSNSSNRQGHNGVLLMSRYANSANLYYAGIRNDGQAIIKKKINGAYYTLAGAQIFGTASQYNRSSNPSLLPLNTWMRLKTEVTNQADGSVKINLFLDRENTGHYTSILSTTDNNVGGTALRAAGYGGIRTDFMDVEFENYRNVQI